jgi:threonine/homoserine/homoserine lactone efflux protein
MLSHLGAFVAVSALVIVTPGPDTALTTRNALLAGRRAGVLTGLGVTTGLVIWSLAAAAGVAAVVRASEPAFVAIKIVGAGYLIVLGSRALLEALRRRPPAHREAAVRPGRRITGRIACRQGVINNLGNPKIAVFFTSLLPPFTGTSHPSFLALLSLGLLFCLLTGVWLTGYSLAVAKAGDFLRKESIRRALDGITGAVLVGLGARLAVEHR